MRFVIYLCSALLLLAAAFAVFRVVVRNDYRTHGRLRPLASFLELLIFCLWATLAYLYRPSDWPATHVSPGVAFAGWALFWGGFLITFAVMAFFGLPRAFGLDSSELKETGAYGLSRNPQSVAGAFAIIGNAVLWPSWPNLGVLALFAAMIHLMVVTEEEHLRSVFGEAYLSYCERVPRYLGRVTRA